MFALVIVAVAGWRGFRALIGIVVAFGVLVVFMLPALRDGSRHPGRAGRVGGDPLRRDLPGTRGEPAHERRAARYVDVASPRCRIVWTAIELAHITGLSEEETNAVATYLGNVSITGLLLAGFIVGSLGVLNDVTITQASTVFELAQVGDGRSRRGSFSAR